MMGACVESNHWAIVTEFLSRGTLADVLRDNIYGAPLSPLCALPRSGSP